MTRKLFFVLATVALVAASCGAGSEPVAAGSSGRILAYSLTGDVDFDYHVDMDMEVTTTFGGSLAALDPSMPTTMNMAMEMGFDTHYFVETGSEPGTYRVTVGFENMEFGSGRIEMGPEKIDFGDLPDAELNDLLAAQVVEAVFVIDDQGEVLSMEVAGQSIDVSGIMGGTSPGTGAMGQMFGPEFPDHDVQPGDAWETTAEQQLPGMDPIITEQTHTVLRREERNGFDTWLIKTKAKTGAFTITWDDVLAMAESLGGLSEVGIDETMPPAFEMVMRSAPTSATMLTWFDPERGVTVAQDVTTYLAMTIEMTGLPDMGGRAVTMDMDGYTHMLMELEG